MKIVKEIIFCLLAVSLPSFAGIYDFDDRHDLHRYALNSPTRQLADAVAMIVSSKAARRLENGAFQLRTESFEKNQKDKGEPLCPGERFRPQPIVVDGAGSGFLVAPDILVTAGHVIDSSEQCQDRLILFGRAYFYPWSDPTLAGADDAYHCKEVIHAVNTDTEDFAVIRLDRPVQGRTPLRVRRSGKVAETANLSLAGHALTLPLKITENGSIRNNQARDYFVTKLDTFAGNSGGPVFDPLSGLVEGILVAGDLTEITLNGEYETGCWYSKVFCDSFKNSPVRCDDDVFNGATVMRSSLFVPYLK